MINIYNLGKYYAKFEVLKKISFDISPGEIVALTGPSGCGKTTLLRVIAGFEKIDSGSILIDKKEASSPDYIIKPNKRNVSMIFQDLALWPHMSVERHLKFTMKDKFDKNTIQLQTDKILSDVKLLGYNKRYPHQLSGGEKQRLAIARALASNAKYLLMDEPFSSLDNILKGELNEIVIQLKRTFNNGILWVTHSILEIADIIDRVVVMKQGQIVQIDRIQNVINSPKNEFINRILNIKDEAI